MFVCIRKPQAKQNSMNKQLGESVFIQEYNIRIKSERERKFAI